MNQPVLSLNDDFKYALDVIEKQGQSVFITGRAGTGKSTLLRLFRNTTRKKTVVLAPTGIAALNVKGQTIHSFFGFPAKPLDRSELFKKRRRHKLYKKIEVLIIDEISMVRADLLDNIDTFLRVNRENPEPFGGVQVVFFGDLFQLPPVVANEVEAQILQNQYDSPYFFSAEVLRNELQLEIIELRKIYRQDNRHFLRLLEMIRLNQMDYDDLEDLNERFFPDFTPEGNYITLSARNATVNSINKRAIAELVTPPFIFMATIKGDFNPKFYPTAATLVLKEGAQVMFIKNDPEKKFVNGTIGKVHRLDADKVEVIVEEGLGKTKVIEVVPMDWEILRYKINEKDPEKIETEVIGSFSQYPLKLAWAITIHKSQGKTFDKVIIDLGSGAFEHGQTYVAFSRCRTLEGIILKQKLKFSDIRTDERIIDFYQNLP